MREVLGRETRRVQACGRWKEAWEAEPEAGVEDERRIWTEVVRNLPLRKKAFERGEVICPAVGAVDWKALCSATYVSIPDWPGRQDRRRSVEAQLARAGRVWERSPAAKGTRAPRRGALGPGAYGCGMSQVLASGEFEPQSGKGR